MACTDPTRPPAHALGARGIVGLVGFGNFLNPDPKADHPDDIIKAVAKDSIDVAIVWGPLAGYWVKRQSVPLTMRSEEHTSELQSRPHLVCRLLLETKNYTTMLRTSV